MLHYQSVPFLHIELHLELVGGKEEGLDFVQVAKSFAGDLFPNVEDYYIVAVAVDADGGVGVLLLSCEAVGDAILQ